MYLFFIFLLSTQLLIFWCSCPNMGNICYALRDLVSFAQFKKGENQPWRSVTFRLQPVALLKVTPPCMGIFLIF